MKSAIVCEGGTDLALLQYFMESGCGWSYAEGARSRTPFHFCKKFKQGADELFIGEVGGCAKIPGAFDKLLETNSLSSLAEEQYSNIIIVSDRDEADMVPAFVTMVENSLTSYGVSHTTLLTNDRWLECTMKNGRELEISFKVLLLIIPFEATGALETFLLDAIAKHDAYDGEIITKCRTFVGGIDPEERYLKHRRYKTKASFDVYFSVRTPLEQFVERRNILRSVNWGEYEQIQTSFRKLRELMTEKAREGILV